MGLWLTSTRFLWVGVIPGGNRLFGERLGLQPPQEPLGTQELLGEVGVGGANGATHCLRAPWGPLPHPAATLTGTHPLGNLSLPYPPPPIAKCGGWGHWESVAL